ncbi:type IV secretion system protein VirB5 [Salmonella enterica]|uniref:Type IV secretion system protein VirB5 n=1 Tax=Salmonella enterica subsp. diarizonae serovar 48:i:z TaxID=1192842 RepID=A0A735RK84_SALDZ|nr:type IV secretion system protein VirB5 [Salmonella enterica]ECX6009991.1 type IV secretion system protein VirB5 [Salmonella enterica subsp. enterica serovar Rubislaw]EDJ9246072.1 type IV secretion system protein VirB5 [Salmonella enterica subsp. diarizonae]EHE7040339.1 type IV secretion system protein VirB5 [Salmonella enterica subsp. enterica serovar Newport]HAE7124387.1 type IV secretion system protein VirB5 [Salmonella enterica subsp. diarizonae serovar 48:i:z]
MNTRLLKAGLLSLALVSPLVKASGIPVVDAVANLQEMAHWLEKVQQWTETVQHYQSQIQAYKDQLATATGVRDIASFVDQAKSLKSDLDKLRKPGQALNDLLLSGGSSRQFDALYEKYKIFDTCNTERSGSYANVCKQQVINKAIQLEQTEEIQNQVSQTLGEINDLANRVALSKDTKESQDLANSIQLKSVMLNTLTTQWEMSVKTAEKREKVLAAERVKQWNQQQLTAPTVDLNS